MRADRPLAARPHLERARPSSPTDGRELAPALPNAAFARYVARQRTIQREDVAAAPPISRGALRDTLLELLGTAETPDVPAVIAAVDAASDEERGRAVRSRRVRDLVRDRLDQDAAITVMASLLEGACRWQNPPGNEFNTYFVTTRGTGRLPAKTTMNCWEMIMYAAYLAGAIDQPWIEEFYVESLGATDQIPAMWRRLGWKDGLPAYPEHQPVAGQLLFYDRGKPLPSHLVLSLGDDQGISLWNEPDGDLTTQRIRIDEIQGTIRIGDAPW